MKRPSELIEESTHTAIDRVRTRFDPIEQIVEGQALNEALLAAQAEVAKLRREAVRTLRMEGWKLREIAEATGMTHQRVAQLEAGMDRKDKA